MIFLPFRIFPFFFFFFELCHKQLPFAYSLNFFSKILFSFMNFCFEGRKKNREQENVFFDLFRAFAHLGRKLPTLYLQNIFLEEDIKKCSQSKRIFITVLIWHKNDCLFVVCSFICFSIFLYYLQGDRDLNNASEIVIYC